MRQLRAASDPNNLIAKPVFSDYVDYRTLGVATNESHTIPTGAKFMTITASTDAYMRAGGTATVPSGDVVDGTGSIYLPAGKTREFALDDVTSIGLISAAASIVTMEFFA